MTAERVAALTVAKKLSVKEFRAAQAGTMG